MRARSLADRLERPLVWVIAAVFTVACVSAVATGSQDPGGGVDRPEAAPDAPAPPSEEAPDVAEASPAVDGAVEPAPGTDPNEDGGVLGASLVPAPGVHRYDVQTTAEDGTTSVEEELREIEVLSGDRITGTVRLTARLGDESQVSVLDWSPTGALVRSTRIDSPAGQGGECAWEPPVPEFGRLEPGATWQLASRCQAPLGGVATTFTVSGTGSVVGRATIDAGGREVAVWQIQRSRTTAIRAEVGGVTREQTAREEGMLYLDPDLGVVVRSEVTLTLGGTETGVSRRVSVLRPA